MTAASWLGFTHFRPGVYVVEKTGRLDHAAQIVAIHSSVRASVVYVATGYRGELALADLELVEERINRNPEKEIK